MAHRFHTSFTSIAQRLHKDFASLEHRFHTDFETVQHLSRAERGDFFTPGTTPGTGRAPEPHPEPHPEPPGTGRAPAAPPPPPRRRRRPRHKFSHPALATEGNRRLALARSFASPARTHVTHDTNPKPKSISRLGSQNDSPPNLQHTGQHLNSIDTLDGDCKNTIAAQRFDRCYAA